MLAGRVVLVLGAGASVSSRSASGKPIKSGDALAEEIARAAGLEYTSEGLSDVVEAAHPILGDSRIKSILETNYLGCSPARELEGLLNYTWRRIYTFNIDDTVRNIPNRSRVQSLRYFNAIKDRREDPKGYSEVQLIHLHGYISDFSSGFIFSVSDYARGASKKLGWYERLGEDFHDYPIVTLSHYHIDTLLRLGQRDEAIQNAKKYFKMIQDMERVYSDQRTSETKGKLLTFIAAGKWEALHYRRGAISYI